MTTTKETTHQNVREYRRMRAWEMHQQGYKQQQIADALGLTQAAVSFIIKRAKAGGVAALRQRKPSGAKARLSPAQKQDLLAKLAQGAAAYGFLGDVWTTLSICGRDCTTGLQRSHTAKVVVAKPRSSTDLQPRYAAPLRPWYTTG